MCRAQKHYPCPYPYPCTYPYPHPYPYPDPYPYPYPDPCPPKNSRKLQKTPENSRFVMTHV